MLLIVRQDDSSKNGVFQGEKVTTRHGNNDENKNKKAFEREDGKVLQKIKHSHRQTGRQTLKMTRIETDKHTDLS